MSGTTNGGRPVDSSRTAMTDAQTRLVALSAMASTMVHELMQPLTAAWNYIGAASRQLREENHSAELIERVARSEALVARAVDIIQGMRTFVLRGTVRGRPASLNEMVEKVRSELCAGNGHVVDLITAFKSDAERVVVDVVQLELVLSNLLLNAVEAVPRGSTAHICIDSRKFDDKVILAVRDSGPGLTAEAFENLFVPLFTTKIDGTGLGLPICKAIVEAHGGELWAAEPSSGGATFYMTLPAADD